MIYDTPVKATVFTVNEFGFFNQTEGYLYEHGRRKYAQYNSAPYVKIKPRRKQKIRGLVQGYNPTLFIVEGWGHDQVKDVGTKTTTTDTVEVKEFGLMFGEKRGNDYNSFINSLISNNTDAVIADYRENK